MTTPSRSGGGFLRVIASWFAVPPPAPATLAIFRIALGALVVFDAATRIPTAGLFLSEAGFFPSALQDADRPSLFNLFGGTWWPVALLVVYGLCGLCLVAGLRARTAALVGWFLILSLHHRNPLVTNGGDFLLRLALLWSCFLPLGAAFSADRAMGRTGLGEWPAGAWIVFRIQASLIYLVTAGHKLASGGWLGGDALSRALQMQEWQKPLAELLARQHGWLPFLGVAVVAVQIAAPIGLLMRFFAVRMVSVAALAGMQMGFFLLFHLGLFPWAALVFLIPFLPLGRAEPAAYGVRRDWRTAVCVAIAACTFSYAALSLVFPKSNPAVEHTLQLTGLNQRWPMFASPPDQSSRVVVLVDSGGDTIDLIARSWAGNGVIAGRPFAFPDASHRLYEDARWSGFLYAVAGNDFAGGEKSQRLVAGRLGAYFASRFPQLAANGWRVVAFTRFHDADDENDGSEDTWSELARSAPAGR